jgi:hypothetical protein
MLETVGTFMVPLLWHIHLAIDAALLSNYTLQGCRVHLWACLSQAADPAVAAGEERAEGSSSG